MNAELFVQAVKYAVVEHGMEQYRSVFLNTPLGPRIIPYWKSALNLFNSLNEEEREILFSIIRQVQVDVVAHIFGILDGTSTLPNYKGDFILTTTDSEEQINGDLHSLFLETEE